MSNPDFVTTEAKPYSKQTLQSPDVESLTDSNFSSYIASPQYTLVMFYAPCKYLNIQT